MPECYECESIALELSNTSRCMKCMERRLKVNEDDNEKLRNKIATIHKLQGAKPVGPQNTDLQGKPPKRNK